MRLADLDPHWISLAQWAKASPPFYVGVSFLCPHCPRGPCPTCGHETEKRLAVYFWPPVDSDGLLGRVFEMADNGGHRRIRGDTFSTLTLDPSIGFDDPPHFHGAIVDGIVTSSYPNAEWVKDSL